MPPRITKPNNPFFTRTDIPDRYFCDRKNETAILIDNIKNGRNTVVKSPRRIGKSSLIKHIFAQDEIKGKYNTLYVDIFGTRNAEEFQKVLQAAFIETPLFKTTKPLKKVAEIAKGVNIDLGSYDGQTYHFPSLGFNNVRLPEFSIPEIFSAYETSNKPGLIVFDEFQQIEKYPERMAAIIRGYVQSMKNTVFIFSGSERHILNTMFQDYRQPFYMSARSMELDIIQLDAYRSFVKEMFSLYDKNITDNAINFMYYVFSGNTFNMQETMNRVFSIAEKQSTANMEDIVQAIDTVLEAKDADYKDLLDRVKNQKDRNLLFCIAAEGVASGLTSSQMMKAYRLDNASSVQHSLENLLENKLDLITRISKNNYILKDRLFELWLAKRGQYLEVKLENAEERFKKEQTELKRIPEITPPQKKP